MEKSKFFPSMRHSKSTAQFAASAKSDVVVVVPNMRRLARVFREYPNRRDDYQLTEVIGRGVTATVWHAKCIPLDATVAVKILDLERMNVQMEEVIHEAQAMCLYNHPNVLSLHTTFVVGKDLWFVEPFVNGGSVFNIMRYKYPKGLDEMVIAIIMKEVAKALEYVHRSGGIHRDVKAGNILIDTDGSVLLADFGVAATIERGGSWGNDKINRNTFVGTPCWMAPEVMEQTAGYDSKADIWSFGITMLELAHGHAPFAKLPPMKVLLMTIQNPPPQLEKERGQRQFSKAMRDLVAKCLQKDPSKRPTASQILESKFFKTIPDTRYLASHLVGNLPSLAARAKMLEEIAEESSSEQSSAASELLKTKEEYVRGVSGWNFGDILSTTKLDSEDMPRSHIKEEKVDNMRRLEEDLTDEVYRHVAHKSLESIPRMDTMSGPGYDASVLSPTKRSTDHTGAFDLYSKHTGHEKNGKPSRFLVTTDSTGTKKASGTATSDTNHASESSQSMTHMRGEDGLANTSGDLGEHDREQHKVSIVGRFRVHQDQVLKKEDKDKLDPKGRTVVTAVSTASTASSFSTGSMLVPPATILSSQLQGFLVKQKQMCQSMESVVDALREAERGHPSALQALVTGISCDPQEALTHRIRELECENKMLRERNHHLEQQLIHLSVSNGSYTTSHDKH